MSETLTLCNSHYIFEAYNTIEKVFPNGLVKVKKYSFDSIKGRLYKNSHNGNSSEEQLQKYLKKRVKERKTKIIDLAFSNSWEYFVTLTFDSSNKEYFPNGYEHSQAITLMVKWLNLLRHNNRNMRYLIVSEFHKESGHLHFHGLFSKVKFDLTESINPHTNKPIVINNIPIYNITNYSLGFSTLSEINDSRKVSIYLSKYITKELVTLKNKKVFWYSRNLLKPTICYRYYQNTLKETLSNCDILYYNKISKLNSQIEFAEYHKN